MVTRKKKPPLRKRSPSLTNPKNRKLISIVVPVFNENENILPLYEAVTHVITPLERRFQFEFIFTDNHSTDGSLDILQQLAAKDHRVKVIRFSKNFGYQRSIHTAYAFSQGDAAVQLDCDLQDPPQLIPEFIEKWQQGYQVVYGVRRFRRESFLIATVRRIFYRLINALSEDELPKDAGDFRLLDRCILVELKKIHDANPYLRGTIATLGFNQVGIPYDRAERVHGYSKFNFSSLMRLAVDGVLNHSIVPLRVATFTGLTASLFTVLGSLAYIFGRFVFGQQWPAGFATTTVLILFSISLNGLFLGIIGEYLGRIYQQVKTRPSVVIEKLINVEV